MIRVKKQDIKNYELMKGFFNKRVGTIRVFKKDSEYYIGENIIGNECYECFGLDEKFYFEFMKKHNTKIENYDELEQIFIHCKWQEFIKSNN